MKTILVPTDFSATSKNAVHYAIELGRQIGATRLILYHAYEIPVAADPLTPLMQMMDVEELKKSCEANMHHFSTVQLRDYDMGKMKVETFCELSTLPAAISDACEKFQPDLLVMGITGKDKLEETLIGSNSVSVARNTTVPVIIVPAEAVFKKLQRVMLACDFKKVMETTPVQPIRQVVESTGALFFVLHIDQSGERPSDQQQRDVLDRLLKGLQPEYLFAENGDFMEGINQAATDHAIDLIITIPKKHGLFERLFRRSHIKMLAFHSHVPLMVIHE